MKNYDRLKRFLDESEQIEIVRNIAIELLENGEWQTSLNIWNTQITLWEQMKGY